MKTEKEDLFCFSRIGMEAQVIVLVGKDADVLLGLNSEFLLLVPGEEILGVFLG